MTDRSRKLLQMLMEFHNDMNKLDKDKENPDGKKATLLAMTTNDIEKLFGVDFVQELMEER